MKLLSRLKYKLFIWLMSDICDRSCCEYCEFASESCLVCDMNYAHVQARKVWGLEEHITTKEEAINVENHQDDDDAMLPF